MQVSKLLIARFRPASTAQHLSHACIQALSHACIQAPSICWILVIDLPDVLTKQIRNTKHCQLREYAAIIERNRVGHNHLVEDTCTDAILRLAL